MTPAIILHASAGGIGLLSGAAALLVRKGDRLHRQLGTVFTISMLIMAVMATYLALSIPQRGNAVGGMFTFYLITTAWMTARRRDMSPGLLDVLALLVAIGITATAAIFGWMAARDPDGILDGVAPPNFYVIAAVSALAAALDIKVILRGSLTAPQRIARHIWRMCTGLFIATGSFFLGQQQVLPTAIQGSPILIVLALAPLPIMLFWLTRARRWTASRSAVAA